ncbi:hypothetical protein HS99_0005515 [Kitasatospora aureofaciens]|uniref:Uncharacterized protein n=1 Tax=Kitasatospora aureofaciens TaxID=1894 RepID=A0A1E7N9B4_KITAU|nr:hypothetical protein HS99_0005515 [Kitasatospora aureofaciens]GGU95819.1 hypothetical protein GCM10010502_57180 [Kitasatospora aureofaciens]
MEDPPGLRRGFVPRGGRHGGTHLRQFLHGRVRRRRVVPAGRRAPRVVTEAMLVETGRAVEDADIQYLEFRGWIPQ